MGCISEKQMHRFGYSTDPAQDMHSQNKDIEKVKNLSDQEQRHYIKTSQFLVVPKECTIKINNEQTLKFNDINQNYLVIRRKLQYGDK